MVPPFLPSYKNTARSLVWAVSLRKIGSPLLNFIMFPLYTVARVVVVTFDENEEEKLNELLHFLSAKKYSEMPDKQNRVLDYGALKINAEYRSVESNGELVQLTNYEFEILYLLAKNPGRIFSKEQIYTQVWKEPYYGAEDNVMGIIRRIRKKIEPDSAKPRYILNVWGMGYKFNGELMK